MKLSCRCSNDPEGGVLRPLGTEFFFWNVKMKKMGFAREWEEPSSHLGFPRAPTVCLIYSHCFPTLISLILEQTVAVLRGHQDDKTLVMRGQLFFSFFWQEKQWTSSTCVITFRFCCCCLCRKVS